MKSPIFLIEYIASKGKPVIISTGIATEEDILDALDACKRMGNNQITLLKCTSAYPAPVEEANLRTMVDMKDRFNVPIGLSDHTLGHAVATAAVALGATVIEKHFILNRLMGGVDSGFSMEPAEFRSMVDQIRLTEAALGVVSYEMTDKKMKARRFSRSLYAVKTIAKGELFTSENVKSIRPGFGMAPMKINAIIGNPSSRNYRKGDPLQEV